MIIPIEIADQDAQYIMAAFSEGYSHNIIDEDGKTIPNPVSQEQFALSNVLLLLKNEVSDYLQRQATGEAKQTIEAARIAAANEAESITFSIAAQQ